MDIKLVLFPHPVNENECRYDIVFKLDHNSGHAAQSVDGLSKTNLILGFNWGGTQIKMRNTRLTSGCLGNV